MAPYAVRLWNLQNSSSAKVGSKILIPVNGIGLKSIPCRFSIIAPNNTRTRSENHRKFKPSTIFSRKPHILYKLYPNTFETTNLPHVVTTVMTFLQQSVLVMNSYPDINVKTKIIDVT